MTEYLGCDYAGPTLGDYPAFRKRGFSFVVRYLTPPGWWNLLTPAEARAIAAAGLELVSVWETNPTHATFFTADRGAEEGALAVLAARSAGQPAGTPIYATVDYDMQPDEWPVVEAYLQAFRQVLGSDYQLGVYGGWEVIDRAQQIATWLWQTYAWSGGRRHRAAILYQFKNTSTIDYDRAFGNPGWWRPVGQLVVATPAPPMEKGGIAVPLTRSGDNGLAVKILQTLLTLAGHVLAVDGDFGPATLEAVKAFQTAKGLTTDGVVGPATWSALTSAAGSASEGLVKAQARLREFADLAAKPL